MAMAHRGGGEDLIGIPFPNHSSDVLCSLNEQRREGLLCDVVLIVRDQEYRTHRSVLAACSQYFKKLFTVATAADPGHPEHHGGAAAVYEIDFVAAECLTAILEFAYTSTLTVTASNVKEILVAARLLEIPCIVDVCTEIMDTGGGDGGKEGDEEDEEDMMEEGEEEEEEDEETGSRKEEERDEEDDASERSTRSSESRDGGTPRDREDATSPSTSQHNQYGLHRDRGSPAQSLDTLSRKQESMESRTLKDFSIESLLQEGLYPRMPILDRRSTFSPLLPAFYPSLWPSDFPGFPPHLLEPSGQSHQQRHLQARRPLHTSQAQPPQQGPYPRPGPLLPQLQSGGGSRPLDLVVKREHIKEEVKDDLLPPPPPPPPSLLNSDFLKEFAGPGGLEGGGPTTTAGPRSSQGHPLGPIKDEADFRSYLSFLSSASHLGSLFPPWQLEEERKMKPKASQQCPICNKVIQGAGKLPRHMRTHTGEKPYVCTICEVRFTRQDKLKIHMRKHTGERPYMCLHCNSKFVHNYDLKNHLRIHTGVRPYQCDHCYKSFTRSDHLHRHIKRQSCRVSRPRRGRKPGSWRSAGAPGNFLCPPTAAANRLEEKRLSPAYAGLKGHGLGQVRGLGRPDVGYKDVEGDGQGCREERRAGRKQPEDREEGVGLGPARQRGVFAFTLSGEEVLSHPPFYSTTPDPWTMRLERAPPIPEPAN